MSPRCRAPFAVFCLTVGLAGCDQSPSPSAPSLASQVSSNLGDSEPTATHAVTNAQNNAAAAKQDRLNAKVELCHRTGANRYVPLAVSVNAERTHRSHGDGAVGETVPGAPAKVFAQGCAPVGVSVPAPESPANPLPTLVVSAQTVTSGQPITVTLTNGFGGASDWLALAATGSMNSSYVQWTYVGAGVTTRTWTATTPAAGTYEFRLFLNDSSNLLAAASAPFTAIAPERPTLFVSTSQASPGARITVTLAGAPGGVGDWLALAPAGAPTTTYLTWTYVGTGVTMLTWPVTMPLTPGTYVFRFFLNNSYTVAATSPPVTVTP